jgi:hypothetical protein
MYHLKRILLVLCVAMLAAACNMGNVGIQQNPAGGIDIQITLTESEVNTLVTQAIAQAEESGRSIRVQNPNVDLQPGQMVISGEYEQQNGTGNFVNGTITLGVTTVDGRVNVVVTSADVNGMQADDERLTEITNRINEVLNSRASRDNGANIALTAISITDNDMTMTINVRQGQ